MHISLEAILTTSTVTKLDEHLDKAGASGLEAIIQERICGALRGSRKEVPLTEIGAESPWNSTRGAVDIVVDKHGIEIKVIEIPHIGLVPSNSLYDVGQISSDYWRIKNAKKLESGELVILLRGPLISILKERQTIGREFHNRMFVDFKTSLYYGELSKEKNESRRKRQISAIMDMGFNRPAGSRIGFKVFVNKRYALVSIPTDG